LNRENEFRFRWLITLIGPSDTRRLDSKKIWPANGWETAAWRSAAAQLSPDSHEDSLFLPRCGHAMGSLFGLGRANGEIAK
jgi:hypothetical protein